MNCHNTVQKPIWTFREDGVRFYSSKWQLSQHVESDSICRDDCQILIGPFLAAADQSENSNHVEG
jgi:hypothetical protein